MISVKDSVIDKILKSHFKKKTSFYQYFYHYLKIVESRCQNKNLNAIFCFPVSKFSFLGDSISPNFIILSNLPPSFFCLINSYQHEILHSHWFFERIHRTTNIYQIWKSFHQKYHCFVHLDFIVYLQVVRDLSFNFLSVN